MQPTLWGPGDMQMLNQEVHINLKRDKDIVIFSDLTHFVHVDATKCTYGALLFKESKFLLIAFFSYSLWCFHSINIYRLCMWGMCHCVFCFEFQ